MNSRQRVLEGDARPAQPLLQSADLAQAPAQDFSGHTYLTTAQAVVYLQFPSLDALYTWVHRQRIPKCRRGRVILLRKRDLDRAVQPAGERHGR